MLFVTGIVILLGGAEGLVRGASSIATRARISPLVIGLTVVAFGTSTPELVVAITALLNQSTDIGIGNIIGSNIANILFTLGIAALVGRITVGQSTIEKEIPFLISASIVLLVMSVDRLLVGGTNTISRLDGILLLMLFALFMWYVYTLSQKPSPIGTKLVQLFRFNTQSYPFFISVPMVVLGLLGLVIGAMLTVDGAEVLARLVGVPELGIGLIVVAIGTSSPELATTVIAVYRRKSDVAIGNIVGSNIFNILWVIGIAGAVSPLPISEPLLFNIGIAALVPIILLVTLTVGKLQLNRLTGLVFLGLYVLYVLYLVVSG